MATEGSSASWGAEQLAGFRASARFVAEVRDVWASPHRDQHLVIVVAAPHGRLERGPAKLVTIDGTTRLIQVLGVEMVNFADPDRVKQGIVHVLARGVSADDVKPDQLLVQGDIL